MGTNTLKIGIVGLGFVGDAMYKSFSNHGINVRGYDKYKNNGILLNTYSLQEIRLSLFFL